jgi:general stress protein 26
LSLTKKAAFKFLSGAKLGAISTVSGDGNPEAAVVNLAVNADLELVFETIQTTRKCENLRRDPRIAVVVWRGDETLQLEGIADEPDEYARRALLETYFAAQPEALGHCGWPGLTYFRVRPRWIRLSRYGRSFSVRELRLPN